MERLIKVVLIAVAFWILVMNCLGYAILYFKGDSSEHSTDLTYNDSIGVDVKFTMKEAYYSLPESLRMKYASEYGNIYVETKPIGKKADGIYMGFLPKTIEAIMGRQIFLFPVIENDGAGHEEENGNILVHEFMNYMWDLKSYRKYEGYHDALSEKASLIDDYYNKSEGLYSNINKKSVYFAEIARLYWQGKLSQEDYPKTCEFLSHVEYLN